MNKKKCVRCGYISEEAIEKCPVCDEEMVEVTEVDEQAVTIAMPAQEEVVSGVEDVSEVLAQADEAAGEEVKSSKTLKIVCAVMAVILLVVVGAYFMMPSGGTAVFNESSFKVDDLKGTLLCDAMGMYYEFIPGEVEGDIIVEIPADEAEKSDADSTSDAEGASDAATSSDAESLIDTSLPQTTTESHTYDGKCISGFTEKYIDKVIATEYINQNNLQEELQKFVEENGITDDGVEEYVKAKGLTKEEINKAEGAQELRDQGASYTTEGYFDYDEENKKIVIYDTSGRKMDSFLIKKEGLVVESGFMEGKTKTGKPFASTFKMRFEEYGVTQVFMLYEDGNFVIKVEYDDENAGQNESIAGTYEVNGNIITMEAEGQKLPYTILKDGIAAYIFTK